MNAHAPRAVGHTDLQRLVKAHDIDTDCMNEVAIEHLRERPLALSSAISDPSPSHIQQSESRCRIGPSDAVPLSNEARHHTPVKSATSPKARRTARQAFNSFMRPEARPESLAGPSRAANPEGPSRPPMNGSFASVESQDSEDINFDAPRAQRRPSRHASADSAGRRTEVARLARQAAHLGPATEKDLRRAAHSMADMSDKNHGYLQRSRFLRQAAKKQMTQVRELRKQIAQERGARVRMLHYLLYWQKIEPLWTEEQLGECVEGIVQDVDAGKSEKGRRNPQHGVHARDAGGDNPGQATSTKLAGARLLPVDDATVQALAGLLKGPTKVAQSGQKRTRPEVDAANEAGGRPHKRLRSEGSEAASSLAKRTTIRRPNKGKEQDKLTLSSRRSQLDASECESVLSVLNAALSEADSDDED